MSLWTKALAAAGAARPDRILSFLRDMAAGRARGDADRDPRDDVAFTIGIIALSAKMAKSDGAVTRDEVAAFKRLVTVPADEEQNVRRLFDLAKQEVAGYEAYARQLAALLSGRSELKYDVLEALYIIAIADGVLHHAEEGYLAAIAAILEVPAAEASYLRSLFVRGAASPYEILGLTPKATMEEIEARRRALAREHHPDRLTGHGVPPEFVALAEKKLAAINAAFDAIKRERGQ